MKPIAFVVWTMVVATLGTACGGSAPESTGGASGAAQGGTGGTGGGGATGAGATGAGATGAGATGAGATGGAPATASSVGDACDPDTQCPAGGSGTPTCLTDWPGGYCAVTGCAPHGHDCPNDPGLGGVGTAGSKCVLAPAETCLALCAGDADCRAGYACVDKDDAANHDPVKVCFPKS